MTTERPGGCDLSYNDTRDVTAMTRSGDRALSGNEITDLVTGAIIKLPGTPIRGIFAGWRACRDGSGRRLHHFQCLDRAETVGTSVTELGHFSNELPFSAIGVAQDGSGVVTVSNSGRMNGVSATAPIFSGIGSTIPQAKRTVAIHKWSSKRSRLAKRRTLSRRRSVTDFAIRLYDLGTGKLLSTIPTPGSE